MLAAIVLMAGLALLGTSGFVVILYAVAILAGIIAVYLVQMRRPVWLPIPVAVLVLWNPVIPFAFTGRWWTIAQFVAALGLLACGLFARSSDPEFRQG